MASRRIAGTFKFPFRTDLRRQQYPKSKCGLTTPETDVFQHTQAMAAARAYFFTIQIAKARSAFAQCAFFPFKNKKT